nr:hypothetical protein [Tanacetum cinerariifolium]
QLVVGERDGSGVVDLEKLDSQVRVAVRMPSTTADYLRSNYTHLNLQGVPMERQALQLLLSQQARYAALERELLAAREDIAKRRAGEESLRLAQFSIDQSTVGILWVNWDSHVRYANRAAESMLGYAPGGVVDRPLIDFEPGLNMDRWLNLWKNARS